MQGKRVLIVDLNNFARYPTLAIGYLVSPLRAAGFDVDVLSPLAHGVPPITREKEEVWVEHVKRRVNFSTHPVMQKLHEPLRRWNSYLENKPNQKTLQAIDDALKHQSPDIILLSAYLEHRAVVEVIAQYAKQKGVPVLLGGPAFTHQDTIKDWLAIEGVKAIFAGEADLIINDLVARVINQESLADFSGVFERGDISKGQVAAPLHDLDRLPIPDLSDFPWDYYPNRIIPVMTGRGCQWGICTFCSDVVTSNGRTYRTRSLDAVLEELAVQSKRYGSKDFIFLDLKLNSNLDMWYGLIENFQKVIPGGRWIGTVHVNDRGDNGLDLNTLEAAHEAGLTRISFGLETGSQNLARRMGKGTDVETNQQFMRDAYRAGLSVRCSMMLGYPGEDVEDLLQTQAFLTSHQDHFDRVRPARFKAIPGTRFESLYHRRPTRFDGLENVIWDYRFARASYEYEPASGNDYRQVKRQILSTIHEINRKPLRDGARQFDGLM